MSARAIWKAKLKLNGTRIPVDLYSAVADRTVHFNILEEKTMTRVKQHMVDPESGKEVPADEIRKAYQVEPGTFVILNDDELESLEPEPSREIEITHFVPPASVDAQMFERPYYLGPDGDQEAYFALTEALNSKGKEGIARWIMRKKEYSGVLRAEGDYLFLVTLRDPKQVVSAKDLPTHAGRDLDQKELKMATQLVEALEGDFDPTEFRDEYRDRVLEFIERKAKSKAPKLHVVRSKRATTSLESALDRSIKQLKKEKKAA
jgi:DNA end-binding protein Ku